MKSKLSSKKSSGWLALLIITLAIVLSCKKQLLPEEQPERQARERMVQWYEANLKVSDGNPFSRLEPNWENVYVSRHGSKNVYEIGLANGEELLVSTDGEQRSLAELSRSSEIRLLIFEDVASGEILYAGYESIQAALPQSLSKLHYRNTGNFNGTILFYHFTGNLSNGWNYVNGRITERINVITEQQFNQAQRQAQGDKKVETTVCKSGYADKYQWQCVGVPGYESCGFNYVGKEYVSYCYWVDNEEAVDHIAPDDHGGYIPPVYVDCAGVAGGTATWSAACNTCIGGTTGLTGCPREIKRDTSITHNAKINCLLQKLLGLDGNAGNAQMKSLLAAFVGKGFDVTFKIGTTKPTSWGEAGEDPYNPTKFNIVLNRNRINEGYQMDWAKTLLHEAFHVNLLQKTYELFGNSAVALWDKNPGNMSFNELMDYTSMKAAISGNPILKAEHHNFMAANFEIIRDGLKSFSLANNPNHSDYNDFHFDALVYKGVDDTSYYLNSVIKNPDGNLKTVTINGHEFVLENVYNSFYDGIRKENIPCN